jgi:hypothetical protein
LFKLAQSYLPSGHPLAALDPHDLDGTIIIPLEEQLMGALRQEAEEPTGDNLPESPDDPRAKREVFDDSLGRKVTVYKARTSFIKAMGRPGLKVLRVMNPNTGQVLYGPPFPQMPGR